MPILRLPRSSRCPRPEGWIATNAHAIAFLDKYPVSEGHTLVVPRRHVESIFELDGEEQTSVWNLSGKVRDRFGKAQTRHRTASMSVRTTEWRPDRRCCMATSTSFLATGRRARSSRWHTLGPSAKGELLGPGRGRSVSTGGISRLHPVTPRARRIPITYSLRCSKPWLIYHWRKIQALMGPLAFLLKKLPPSSFHPIGHMPHRFTFRTERTVYCGKTMVCGISQSLVCCQGSAGFPNVRITKALGRSLEITHPRCGSGSEGKSIVETPNNWTERD